MTEKTLDDILARYDWYDHPDGPKFVETHRDAHRTSGHYLFLPGRVSWFHKVLDNAELWLVHSGRVHLHVIDPGGRHTLHRLGLDVRAGEVPAAEVPVGFWQAAEIPEGELFAFGTCVCAPPFSFERFAIASRAELLREFPAHRELIERLTK